MEGRNNFSLRGRGRGWRGGQPRGMRGRGGIRRRDRGRRARPEGENCQRKNFTEKRTYGNNNYKNKNGAHFSYPKLVEITKKDDNEIIFKYSYFC